MSIRPAVLAALLAGVAVAAGCSGGDGPGPKPPSVASPEDFPRAAGKTLAELRRGAGQAGPVISPAVLRLVPGRNRFAFGLFDRSRKPIADAAVAVYAAPAGGGEASGPFVARWESLEVRPQFRSRSTAGDPDAVESVYVAQLELDEPGRYELLGLAQLDDRLLAATPAGPPLTVVKRDPVPGVGDPAPPIHTPTEEDVAGDLERIDTRVPPSSMHEVDFAEVLGERPIVLLFATPRLCQSRVCGPVVDIAEQVKAEHPDAAEFIHMEIYRDNRLDGGYRPQVRRFGLPTEPWAFAIDAEGRVAARLEGAFSARELTRALERATGG